MVRTITRWAMLSLVVLSLLSSCTKNETPVADTATTTATPPAPAGPTPPPMCAAAKNQCQPGQSICATSIGPAQAAIPGDICTIEDQQDFVDIYSWNAFLALNWPANTGNCAADPAKSILNVKSGDGTFVVWQTYMPSEKVFVNPGTQKPAAWCSGNALVEGERRIMTHEAKATAAAKLKGGNFLKIASPGGDVLQASGDVVTDQAGRWLRYERLMNQVEYNYIVPDRWNSVQLQAMWNKGQGLSLPKGSIELKSSWKVLTPSEISGGRYFTTKAIVCNTPDGARTPCDDQPVTLGLVGLHIVQQNNNGGTMFWSTFEQVDNDKVFRNPTSTAPVNTDFAKQPFTELGPNCQPLNQPTQIKRMTPIPASAALNSYYQQLLAGSVFANYQLVSTQWTTGAGGSAFGTPANVANITLETYVQQITGAPQQPLATGCMACHLSATTNIKNAAGAFQPSGHSFLFLESQFATMGGS